MWHKNLTDIGAALLIPFCGIISHTVLPIPPTVICFILSAILALSLLSVNNFKLGKLNAYSALPVFLSFYLFLSQLMLGVEIRPLISPCLAPLYFVLTLFFLNRLDRKEIEFYIDKFIYISLVVFVVECLWRLTHPHLPEGIGEVDIEKYSRWYYWFKGAGLMYIETNGLAIHLLVIYFFVLWWAPIRNRKMLRVKTILLVLIILTFSRAAILSVPIGWIYRYYFSKLKGDRQILLLFIIMLFFVFAVPFVVSILQNDPSTQEKLVAFTKIFNYYRDVNLFSFLYGIGNYNSKVAFGIYAHNYLLVFFVEMGALGLMLILSQFYVFIKWSKGQFLFVFVPFFVQIMSSTIIFIPYFYMIAAIMIYYAQYNIIKK